MIFNSLTEYDNYIRNNSTDTLFQGLFVYMPTEDLPEVIEWKCKKAKETGLPVFVAVVAYGRLILDNTEFMELVNKLETLADFVLILYPDSLDGMPKVDYKYFNSVNHSFLNEKTTSNLKDCYTTNYMFRSNSTVKGLTNKMYFAQDGVLTFENMKALEGKLMRERTPIICKEILRGDYNLIKNRRNILNISIIKQKVPEAMQELSLLHEYDNNKPILQYFDIRYQDTIPSTEYDINDVAQIYFKLKNWPYGTIIIDDIIVRG